MERPVSYGIMLGFQASAPCLKKKSYYVAEMCAFSSSFAISCHHSHFAVDKIIYSELIAQNRFEAALLWPG